MERIKEISVIEFANLTLGKKKKMTEDEYKGRCEVASNFLKHFKVKIKIK